MSMIEIKTLCRGRGCCPVLHKSSTSNNIFYITDDDDGIVKLSKEQLIILKETILKIEKE
jgi:hypothetical protein